MGFLFKAVSALVIFNVLRTADAKSQASQACATSVVDAHDHTAYLDADGNGLTSLDFGHRHRITNGVVGPSVFNGHVHELGECNPME